MRGLALGLLIAGMAGCGPTEAPLTAVEGVVSLDGQPLANVQVQFIPEVEPGSARLPFSTGVTDPHGRFVLMCENNKPGAVVGQHRVVLRYLKKPRNPDLPPPPPPHPPIPMRYQSLLDTPLKVDVKTDQSVYNLVLSP